MPNQLRSVFGRNFAILGEKRFSRFAVVPYEPKLVFDFPSAYYRTGGVDRASLSDAMTFARAGSATYVDATGTIQTAAANVPRAGHHVWNGSAWVNEGLLHESEARTNLVAHSSLFTDFLVKGAGQTITSGATFAGLDASTVVLTGDTTTDYRDKNEFVPSASTTYTFSFFVSGTSGVFRVEIDDRNNLGNRFQVSLDVSTGVVSHALLINRSDGGAILSSQAEAFGTGWRVSLTFTTGSLAATAMVTSIRRGDVGTYVIAGRQYEAAPTPSSYIPTSGSTVTRAADVMTIPAANLPWPTPEYIGPELVTNGTFDTDTTGWNVLFGSISWSGGKLLLTEDGADGATARAYQGITTEVGKVYRVTADVGAVSLGSASIVASTSTNVGGFPAVASAGNETVELIFVAAATTTTIIVSVIGITARTAEFDNISVREINPLAVSIQMDGRVTYADEDNFETVILAQWQTDVNNRLQLRIDTASTQTGRFAVNQVASGSAFFLGEAGNTYTPGVLGPFNVAGRFGSNFLNGAREGTALTARTDVTALPDLSSDDLTLGYDYMGTIRTFRMWPNDLGDTGIEEASA